MKILVLICLIMAATPISRSWSSPVCDLDLSVTLISPNEQFLDPGKSVSEVFEGRDKADPFLSFAETAEKALLKTVTDNLCAGDTSGNPVSVDLTFIRLELMSSKPEIDRLRRELSEMKGSYADVTVDRARRAVRATIVWNPRRMLRDQLAVEGWKFDEDLPLLPLSRNEFNELRKRIYEPSFDEKGNMQPALILRVPGGDGDMQVVKQRVGGSYPNDMFGLIIAGRKNRPFSASGDSFAIAIKRLIRSSGQGYSAMTEAAIHRAFRYEKQPSLNSVQDVTDPSLHNLYKKGSWSAGIRGC